MKLTAPQRRELQYATQNKFGLITEHPINGLGRSAKRRMMERLCAAGLFKPYIHGGYEITDAGRLAADTGLFTEKMEEA